MQDGGERSSSLHEDSFSLFSFEEMQLLGLLLSSSTRPSSRRSSCRSVCLAFFVSVSLDGSRAVVLDRLSRFFLFFSLAMDRRHPHTSLPPSFVFFLSTLFASHPFFAFFAFFAFFPSLPFLRSLESPLPEAFLRATRVPLDFCVSLRKPGRPNDDVPRKELNRLSTALERISQKLSRRAPTATRSDSTMQGVAAETAATFSTQELPGVRCKGATGPVRVDDSKSVFPSNSFRGQTS
ncbi:putative transmembrane protein [Toxoplasma gondii RUB]|uniref:Transmembrane protein n=9 Tax=Toxoplasma gondii TaxID=5811 RepID=V4Z3E9_TOXGV|nr:putative transmembrane protein [Toxoplasma gondii VEG]KFG28255.1 putative transmembrane protein [Toxoplasma gondii p89]KFG30383.1 putative transmembrane protein [Toxoplasma gondii GAB2-2007-GAL-DOM2]KFG35218.1 putative transmembrane protein [Toxoplasma gondii FOU]KFG57069.1 putative transmembrane protein [Toxoplasma gondii RUB]KFG99780.1 putative transmembrane protein [Toxoplasma gondii VAND]PUA84159.1 putative transmembrane protein [Toxoplasma gondii TgCATBr9]RQX67024.1 putative transmem